MGSKCRFASAASALSTCLTILYLIWAVAALARGDAFHVIWYFAASVASDRLA